MKTLNTLCVVPGLALGAAACGGPTDGESDPSSPEMPKELLSARPAPAGYHVVALPSLGGTLSIGNSINDRTWVAGYSRLPGDLTIRAKGGPCGTGARLDPKAGEKAPDVFRHRGLRAPAPCPSAPHK